MEITALRNERQTTRDKIETSRGQESLFSMATRKGVYTLLRDKHHIAARTFTGDFIASDILLDLVQAIEYAKLTPRQEETIFLLFELDLTQQEAASRMGIKQHTVSSNLKGALQKIALVYSSWGE